MLERRRKRLSTGASSGNFEDSATELSLRRGTVSAIDASLISAVLLSPALALVKLDLRTSQMGAREVASVANGLAKNNTLTFLNLSGNALSDGAIVSGEYEQAKLPPNGGLAASGACLRVNTALQELDLSQNRIEAKGLAVLSLTAHAHRLRRGRSCRRSSLPGSFCASCAHRASAWMSSAHLG